MRDYRYITAAALLGNVLGAVVIFSYFAYVDLETFFANKAFWRGAQADWTTFWAAMGIVSLAIVGLSLYVARPLQDWEQRLQAGQPASSVPDPIRRRAATYPLYLVAASLILWGLVGLFFAQGGRRWASTDPATFWRTFLGVAVIGGVVVSTLVFLVTEGLWRRHLPVFFPAGHIRQTGTVRVLVSQRLIATLALTGLVPLVTLAVAALNRALSEVAADPAEILNRLQITILYIVIAGIVSNLLISSFTAGSLLRPLQRLTTAMRQVGTGDLSVRIPVESNDELGDLADDFNRMLGELQQSQRMRDLFGRYVSREVAEQVLRTGADLGGENVPATALFADIRNFTGLSERLPPQQVVGILNRYYTRMVDVVAAEGGIVNKFGGDSLLAIFGVPIRQSDHALRAVRAAWQMKRALAEFNAEQAASGLPPLASGVGISSGEVIAGNVGGAQRLEYTVIGDPVNLASRLQSLTKELGAPVLLSEHTHNLIGPGKAQAQPLERITVRGKQEATLVYELCGVEAQDG